VNVDIVCGTQSTFGLSFVADQLLSVLHSETLPDDIGTV
jgi:hypothetical protein